MFLLWADNIGHDDVLLFLTMKYLLDDTIKVLNC